MADPYRTNLEARIHNAYTQFFGFDKTKDLKQLTNQLRTTHLSAIKDISLFKKMLDIDFDNAPKRKKEIILTLGLDAFPQNARNDQKIMIQLLYTFKETMTPALQNELMSKGIPNTPILNIVGHADVMESLDVKQEVSKTEKIELTAEAQAELNSIYKEVIGICSIARTLFSDDPIILCKFPFNGLLKAMNKPKTEPPAEEDENTQP